MEMLCHGRPTGTGRRLRTSKDRDIEEKYRLWYVDNANHTDPTTEILETHAVAYSGTLQYALRELSAWVEQGVVPPPTSKYLVQDGQVHVPDRRQNARESSPWSISPSTVANVPRSRLAKQSPSSHGSRCRPPWAGLFRRSGTSRERARIRDVAGLGDPDVGDRRTWARTYAFTNPGTYFPTLRVASQREGDPSTPFARSLNLGRVRVVVGE